MHISTKLSFSAALLALGYLLCLHSPVDTVFIDQCAADLWITDTCVESAYWAEYH